MNQQKNAKPAQQECSPRSAGTGIILASKREKPTEINLKGLLFKKHLCRAAYSCYRQAETETEFFTLIAGASAIIDELPQFDENDKQTYRALCLALKEEFRPGGEKAC